MAWLKNVSKFLIVLSCFFFNGCNVKPVIDGENLLVLRGGSIIDGTGSGITVGKDIIIENGLIRAISNIETFTYPENTTIVDLEGKYLLPGFIEMHSHLPGDTSIQAEVLGKYLSFGVTTILNPMADSLSGLGLKKKVEAGQILGPKIYSAGKGINGSSWADNLGSVAPVTSEQEVREEVRSQARQGVDFVKVYAHLPFNLLQVAIDEAHNQNLKVIGHLGKTSWGEATEAGIDIIVHSALAGPTWELVPDDQQEKFKSNYFTSLEWPNDYDPTLFSVWGELVNYDNEKTKNLISALRNHKVSVDPNLVVFEALIWGNKEETKSQLGTDYAPNKIKAQWTSDRNPALTSWTEDDFLAVQKTWPRFLEFVRKLHENEVLLTAGSDYINPWISPGASYHRELELLVDAGIPSSEVVKIATRNGAKVLGKLDEFGTIEEGKVADLVILESDPIEEISNTKKVYSVVLGGKLITKKELDNIH